MEESKIEMTVTLSRPVLPFPSHVQELANLSNFYLSFKLFCLFPLPFYSSLHLTPSLI